LIMPERADLVWRSVLGMSRQPAKVGLKWG
jgi:hypothetical protein